MMSWVNPSAKYSRAASLPWFTSGRTAIAGLAPISGLLVRRSIGTSRKARQVSNRSRCRPTTAPPRPASQGRATRPDRCVGRRPPARAERAASARRAPDQPIARARDTAGAAPVDDARRGNDRHVGFEPIAAPRDRPDQARPVVSQGAAQLADALHQRVVRDGEVRPDRAKELVLRDETAGIFDQVIQDRESLGPKRNLVAVEKQAAAMQIQHIAIEPQSFCVRLRRRPGIVSGHRRAIRANPV